MEQYFLDHRRYDDGAGNCGQPPPRASAADAFGIACAASRDAYLVTATGVAGRGMTGFVYAIDEVPRTLSGKVLEVPVKRILMGTPAEKAASRDSLANPAALDWFVELAARR